MARVQEQNGWVEVVNNKSGRVWYGYWNAYEVVDGQRKKKRKERKLGACSKLTKGQAQTKLRELIKAVAEGRDPNQPLAPVVETFEDAARKYLRLRETHWKKTHYKAVRSLFNCHIIPILGKRDGKPVRIDAIKPTDVQLLFNQVSVNGVSQSGMKKIVSHTRAVFDMWLDDNPELTCRNPGKASSIRIPPKVKPVDKTVLSINEVQRLLMIVQDQPRDYLIVRLLFVYGLRPSELFALRVNDVTEDYLTIDEAVVLGEFDTTKTVASEAPVPMPPKLHRELLAYIASEKIADEPHSLLFPSEIGTAMLTDNYLDRQLKEFAKLASIKKCNFRIIRRTVATHFHPANIKNTQALLRHADAATTLGVYQQPISAELVKDVSDWDRVVSVQGGQIQ